jgi:hypothetical protein
MPVSTKHQADVSINKVVWISTIATSLIYITFGMMAASSFEHVGSNLLVLLASSKVHFLTRICAALFGVSIIGCGVPVFCVIVKDTLAGSGRFDSREAFFIGAILPYCISWLLYQGTLLISLLNWTGLIINGMVRTNRN